GRANDALTLPSTAITGQGAGATVTVLRNGQQTVVPVRLGIEGDNVTQILSGVSQGDQVVIPTASTATGGGFGGFRFGAGGGIGGAVPGATGGGAGGRRGGG